MATSWIGGRTFGLWKFAAPVFAESHDSSEVPIMVLLSSDIGGVVVVLHIPNVVHNVSWHKYYGRNSKSLGFDISFYYW